MNTAAILPENVRVLVAEDHPLNQMLVRKFLERFGIVRVEFALNGFGAFSRYKASKWDVILMDCHMPQMDGYEATKQIRFLEQKTGESVFIIAMTANTLEGEREKCLNCGMNEYISKPIDIGELKRALQKRVKFEDEAAEEPGVKKAPNNLTPVDVSVLRTFAQGSVSMEKEMVRLFIEQSDKNMDIVQKSHARKDYKTLKETAHMLKGGAGNIGAAALSHICDRIEYFQGTDGGMTALVESLGKEYGRVKHYLQGLDLLGALHGTDS